jgi:hypothetical protein
MVSFATEPGIFDWLVVDKQNKSGVIRAKHGLPSDIDNDVEECEELFGKL